MAGCSEHDPSTRLSRMTDRERADVALIISIPAGSVLISLCVGLGFLVSGLAAPDDQRSVVTFMILLACFATPFLAWAIAGKMDTPPPGRFQHTDGRLEAGQDGSL